MRAPTTTAPEGSRTVPEMVSACKSIGLARQSSSNASFGNKESRVRCAATRWRVTRSRGNKDHRSNVAEHRTSPEEDSKGGGKIIFKSQALNNHIKLFSLNFIVHLSQARSRTPKVGVTLCTTVMLLEWLSVCDIIRSLLSGQHGICILNRIGGQVVYGDNNIRETHV